MNIPNGLTSAEVRQRTAAGQANVTKEKTSRSVGDILRENILTRFNMLLGALFVVIIAVGQPQDALFGLVIIFNSAIGIIQELRAKTALDRLAILNSPTVQVLRDGKLSEIPIAQIVQDDVLFLKTGDQVPTDGEIIGAESLEANESLLTGESEPHIKREGDRVLSGSVVVSGRAYMHVTAVGNAVYARQLTAKAKKFRRTHSELEDGINRLLKYISWAVLIVGPLLVWSQISRSGAPLPEALVRSVAAIVGMIPEGLVLLTSLAFAVAVVALTRRKVLVQQLSAVEGLARVDVLCIDKTGTLTDGRIEVTEIISDSISKTTLSRILSTFSHESDSPVSQALRDYLPHIEAIENPSFAPFSSARKWSGLTTSQHGYWVLGAPEIICADSNQELCRRAAAIAATGKRVLALAESPKPPDKQLPPNLNLSALVVLSERLRTDARDTLRYFAEQNVELKIISGDNPQTVAAVVANLGLDPGEPFDARDLPTNQAELATILQSHHVFGRVVPEQKSTMIKALQSTGHTVAMTGDGVNDILALKDADLGIAMGSGSPASRAIADIVLLNNRFANLPQVLAEGRRVIGNIERVANLFVTKNVYSLVLALAVTIANIPFPFLPRHLTLLSSLTIGIPAFFLALAPNRRRYIPGFLPRVLRFAVPAGILIALLILAVYAAIGGQDTNTPASIVVILVGTWILLRLAEPLNAWKITLVSLVPAVFTALLVISQTRQFFALSLKPSQLLVSIPLSALGVVLIELLWRRSAITRGLGYDTQNLT